MCVLIVRVVDVVVFCMQSCGCAELSTLQTHGCITESLSIHRLVAHHHQEEFLRACSCLGTYLDCAIVEAWLPFHGIASVQSMQP